MRNLMGRTGIHIIENRVAGSDNDMGALEQTS